ncbi:hypothetical protein WJX73_004155 [Symbiochloris irregularis]|uniref:Nucleolar complex protein 2 homolog n=1 Tax=Symbiochloris irregularis TaxID=706552 RepID=A0AAW1NNI9_9CHLO
MGAAKRLQAEPSAALARKRKKLKAKPAGLGPLQSTPADSEAVNETHSARPESGRHESTGAGEASQHKADLEALKQQDPDFYAYLDQTDRGLLDFDLGSDASGSSDSEAQQGDHQGQAADSDDDADADKEDAPPMQQLEEDMHVPPLKAKPTKSLSSEGVDLLCQRAKETGSAKATQQLLQVYRTACHVGDADENLPGSTQALGTAALDKLVLFMLTEAHDIFCGMLGVSAGCKLQQLRTCQRWPKVQPLIKTFLGNSLHLLGSLTHASLQAFALRRMRASVVFLVSSDAVQRKLMRHALQVMGSADASARVQAFLLVREMASVLPAPTLSNAMKGVYRVFVRNAKFVSAASMPHIHFLGACVIEMFGLDFSLSYEHAFTHIRELASLLRGALAMKTKDAYREVYCWQTTCTLELWGRLVGAHHENEELRSLAYPVAQLLLGSLRLMPTPTFLPLRLRLARALVALEAETKLCIPLGSVLLDMLTWKGLSQKVKASGPGGGMSSAPTIRAGKTMLASPSFQQNVVEQVIEALARHLTHWAFSPAFPELSHLPSLRLRKLAKTLPVERFRGMVKALIVAVEAQATLVTQHRAELACAPTDVEAVAQFMADPALREQAPLTQYTAQLGQKEALPVNPWIAMSQGMDSHADAGPDDLQEYVPSDDDE